MKKLTALLLMFFCSTAIADDWINSPQIAALFEAAGVEGAFVLYDVVGHTMTGHNQVRATYRYPPASTFQIPHTLIGLSTGVVANLDEVLSANGQAAPVDGRQAGVSLRQAMALSHAATYQALAQRIGPAQMQSHISALIYGNREFGSTMRPFWEEGPLVISAVEQVRFLSLLVQDALPYPQTLLKTVKDLVKLESGDGWTLYAKTGSKDGPGSGIGWWIGWIETSDRIYTFALNMDIETAEDGAFQEQLGRASLRALNML